MRLVLRTIVLVGLTGLLCCKAPDSPQATDEATLEGTWALTTAGSKPPSELNIASWQITFEPDGTWSYAAKMSGSLQGMHLSGKGTWRRQDQRLFFTAGANEGESRLEVSANELRLDPDPVVTGPGGEPPLATVYQRLPQ